MCTCRCPAGFSGALCEARVDETDTPSTTLAGRQEGLATARSGVNERAASSTAGTASPDGDGGIGDGWIAGIVVVALLVIAAILVALGLRVRARRAGQVGVARRPGGRKSLVALPSEFDQASPVTEWANPLATCEGDELESEQTESSV